MSEGRSLTGEVAGGVRSVLDRVGEFFHIFDLSFFVGGAMTFGALAFVYVQMGYPQHFPFAPWVGVLAVVVACYVCGLLAFAVGRELSALTVRSRTLRETMSAALTAHELSEVVAIKKYTGDEGPLRLYIRMWSEVIHERSAPAVTHHLMRYWAMSATYDGVAFAFLVWAVALIFPMFPPAPRRPIDYCAGVAGVLLCLLAARFAFRRGAVYYKYQIEDLVAHFAVSRGKLVVGADPLT